MSNTAVLDRLRQERDQARDAAIALAEAEDFDPAQPGPLTELEERATTLDKQIERLAALQQQRAAADQLDGRLAKAVQTRAEQQTPIAAGLSWGDAFTRSDEFLNYRQRGSSPMFYLEVGAHEDRALPTSLQGLVTAGLTPTKTVVDTTPNRAPTPLLDSINRVQVAGNAIEFVSWAKVAGGAAVVAEGAAKPSAEWAPTVTPDVLDTIAVYTQLTRQLIEDMPAVRDYINGELQRDVVRAEEDGAAAALAAATLPAVTGSDLLGAIRVGIATVQEEGYAPNAVLLNPQDWADLDNVVMGATLAGPVIRQSFWGLTPIPSSAQAAGTAVVGDFRAGMTQFYRSQVALYVTDSHANTFLSNVFTLLAERRAKSVVVRPQALVECSVAVVP
jgi:HK97 family phage major capsid protein